MRFLYDGTVYGTDAVIKIGAMNYVVRRLSPEKRAALGITVVEDPARQIVSTPPDYPHRVTGETEELVGNVLQVTQSYVPDQDAYQVAMEQHIDTVAAERQYSGAVSISTYVNSTNELWAAEANAFVAWRDAVWIYAFTEMAKVQNGQRTPPTIADLLAELPAIEWPA